jgi:hypothetical protein
MLVLLAGCNSLLGLAPTREIDSPVVPDARPDAVGCAGSRFANTITVAVGGHPSMYDPSQSDDPLEIFFTWATTTSEFKVATATRGALDQPFGMPAIATFGRTPRDGDPAITSDGLHILFMSDNQVFQTDRATRQSPWSASTIVPGIDQFTVLGIDISLDGLTIYFSDGWQLFTATRPDVMAPFGNPTKLAVGVNITFPGISPDERELNNGADPDVSPDSRTLYYIVDGDLTAMHRDCP